MGFERVLARWESEGREEDAFRVRTDLAAFRKSHEQVYANLDSEEDEPLERLLDDMLRSRRGETSDRTQHPAGIMEQFCRDNQLKGPLRSEAQQVALGRVIIREAFELSLVRDPTAPQTEKDLGSPPSTDEILAMNLQDQRRELSDRLLAPYNIMWSFFQTDSPHDPFVGFEGATSEFANRLGLRSAREKDLVYWAHRLDAAKQTARFPTAFDAGLIAEWRPGGKTRCLDGGEGLPETVHIRVGGRQLE